MPRGPGATVSARDWRRCIRDAGTRAARPWIILSFPFGSTEPDMLISDDLLRALRDARHIV